MSKVASKPDQKEIHLFIIWENARSIEKKILEDIAQKFKIIKSYEVCWSKANFSQNLSRFYGTNLPPNSRKEMHVGTNPFLAVIVEDRQPVYKIHTTSKGDKHVNSNLFSAKAIHREWTGGGHKIHATNTLAEANHDLTLLFGLNVEDFLKQSSRQSGSDLAKWRKDLVGCKKWDSLTQLFYVLNNTLEYVVLRNFDALPDKYYAKNHGDIDLLVSDYRDASFITNSRSVYKSRYRVHNTVNIKGEKIYFDFRNLEDHYYDTKWQEAILKNRLFVPSGFYVPNPRDHFYSLLYHALIHKPEISQDYIHKLTKMAASLKIKLDQEAFASDQAIDILSKFLRTNSYSFTQPNDKSVYFHTENVAAGRALGVKLVRTRRNPLRNYLKKNKVPLKHYLQKIRRITRGRLKKITH